MMKVYNEHMGGADRMDQNVSKYRIAIRDKKWYSSDVTYFIDVAINNAWLIHRICHSEDSSDLLAFRRGIAETYMKRNANPQNYRRQVGPSNRLDDSLFDMFSHWIVPQNMHTRCAHCHMKTTRCEKCNRGLDVKCSTRPNV